MYLLILATILSADCTASFTFHNVSINSKNSFSKNDDNINLHSIMYLLIRETWENGYINEIIYIP